MRQLYADEAKTGTSTVNRDAFNEMMRDAMDGKFDMLITKSITRFARNTLDMYYQMLEIHIL